MANELVITASWSALTIVRMTSCHGFKKPRARKVLLEIIVQHLLYRETP